MNVVLLRRVAQHIAEEPKRYNQDYWIIRAELFFENLLDRPPCNTVACIAGWTYLLGTGKESAFYSGYTDGSFEEPVAWAAQRLLDLTTDQADRLFSSVDSDLLPSKWPEDLVTRYKTASIEERAKIAVERIERFIQSNGEE